jgi:transcriptional regulator with XRE-family HTH domain
MQAERKRVGERIRRLREERGLSQRELAEPGVSYAYLSRVEAGQRVPSEKALRTLAAKLGVTPCTSRSARMTPPARTAGAHPAGLLRVLGESGELLADALVAGVLGEDALEVLPRLRLFPLHEVVLRSLGQGVMADLRRAGA